MTFPPAEAGQGEQPQMERSDAGPKLVPRAALPGDSLDLPQTAPSRAIDAVLSALHYLVNWIWVVLIVLIVCNVVLRYIVDTNYIALEELQWHLYAIGFMIGIAYALKSDGHVRVDVIADRLRPRARAWIELLGLLLFVLPLCYIMIVNGWPFVERSWRIDEVSAAPGGLPHRWAIKSVIIIAFALIALAALSRLLRVSAALFGIPRPRLG